MSESTEIEYLLTVNIEDAQLQVRQLERMLFRVLHLIRRMGLPEDVERAITAIQRFISILRMLRITMALLEAGTPYGLVMGALGLGTAAFSMGDMYYDGMRGQ